MQNDLNSLGLAMRDMLDNDEPYPLTAWSAQFQRIRTDLDRRSAARRDRSPSPVALPTNQYLEIRSRNFGMRRTAPSLWRARVKEAEARAQIRLSLQARQAALSTAVSRLLVQNNESEEQAAPAHCANLRSRAAPGLSLSHCHADRHSATSLYLIRSNRRLFAQLAVLSAAAQRTGAEIDCHAGIHAAPHFARTA